MVKLLQSLFLFPVVVFAQKGKDGNPHKLYIDDVEFIESNAIAAVKASPILAIASPTHAVPASMYYTGWANQDSIGQQYRRAWGQTSEGSMYTNGNTYFGIKLDVGV